MTDSVAIRKVLVATDGSDTSVAAARYAAEIARCTAPEIVIVYAAEVSGLTQFVTYSLFSEEGSSREFRQTGEEIIAKTKKPFLQADLHVRSKIIEGFAPEVILNEAKEGQYDLIVMGSRGSGAGLMKKVVLGLGSVAERVLGNSPCPVLIYRV